MDPWNPLFTGAMWIVVILVAVYGSRGETKMIRKARELRESGAALTDDQHVLANEDEPSGVTSTSQDGKTTIELSKHDLVLGARACRYFNRVTLVAIVAAVILSIWPYTIMPLDTAIIGRIHRHSEPGPRTAWVFLIPVLLWLLMMWRTGRKPDSSHMRSRSRKALFAMGMPMVLWPVYFQMVFALQIIYEGF